MALMHFTRCTLEGVGPPFLPTHGQVKEEILPLMDGCDTVVLSWTHATLRRVPELPTITTDGAIMLSAQPDSCRKYGNRGLQLASMLEKSFKSSVTTV